MCRIELNPHPLAALVVPRRTAFFKSSAILAARALDDFCSRCGKSLGPRGLTQLKSYTLCRRYTGVATEVSGVVGFGSVLFKPVKALDLILTDVNKWGFCTLPSFQQVQSLLITSDKKIVSKDYYSISSYNMFYYVAVKLHPAKDLHACLGLNHI
jgi:hypothetical protein